MSDHLYHFTDTRHLPWILNDAQLNLAGNAVGNYPEPSFLWATTDARGDHTASAMGPLSLAAYRDGQSLLVRFALRAEDFEPWPEITAPFPAWTPEQIARLDASGRRLGSDPRKWFARAAPLHCDRILAIEARAYRDPRWRLLPPPLVVIPLDEVTLGVKIGPGTCYASKSFVDETGRRGYVHAVLRSEEFDELERRTIAGRLLP